MQKIVLDTNCLIQSLPKRSPFHKIWTDVLEKRISLCVNTEILEEYEEKLAEKMTPQIAKNVVEAIARLSSTTYQETFVHFFLITQDPDDNKFVDCAIAANAEYIVSNDSHFQSLNKLPWPELTIVDINTFIKRIQ